MGMTPKLFYLISGPNPPIKENQTCTQFHRLSKRSCTSRDTMRKLTKNRKEGGVDQEYDAKGIPTLLSRRARSSHLQSNIYIHIHIHIQRRIKLAIILLTHPQRHSHPPRKTIMTMGDKLRH
jgi:hypothetical protein